MATTRNTIRFPSVAPGAPAPALQSASHALRSTESLDPLLDRIGEARIVMLGEASHGTSEYYQWRARISQRLIAEKGFDFIAVEGDWPDCYQVNRYIKGYPEAGNSALQVLQAYERWPTWMWANWEVVALCEWLRRHNAGRARQAGFYGLDVYSLWESMTAIMDYLRQSHPEAVAAAREAYLCFEPYGESEQAYAWATRMVPTTCENEVVRVLHALRQSGRSYDSDPEAAFNAEQNALVMVNAERYYRAMVQSNAGSWNVRDRHMAETLDRLLDFHGPQSRAIVWAHNTHIGDARFTDMAGAGMVNLGQLAREQHDQEGVVLAGFGSLQGTVIAAPEWGALMEVMQVPEARPGSWEDMLHDANPGDQLLLLDELRPNEALMEARGHRAIGVVYNPEHEAYGNYVPTILPGRYDAFLYIDQSHALHPLHIEPKKFDPPDTYPWGL